MNKQMVLLDENSETEINGVMFSTNNSIPNQIVLAYIDRQLRMLWNPSVTKAMVPILTNEKPSSNIFPYYQICNNDLTIGFLYEFDMAIALSQAIVKTNFGKLLQKFDLYADFIRTATTINPKLYEAIRYTNKDGFIILNESQQFVEELIIKAISIKSINHAKHNR